MQRCTLRCDNVAGTSFSQRSEKNLLATLYNVVFTLCVCTLVLGGSTKWENRGCEAFCFFFKE